MIKSVITNTPQVNFDMNIAYDIFLDPLKKNMFFNIVAVLYFCCGFLNYFKSQLFLKSSTFDLLPKVPTVYISNSCKFYLISITMQLFLRLGKLEVNFYQTFFFGGKAIFYWRCAKNNSLLTRKSSFYEF